MQADGKKSLNVHKRSFQPLNLKHLGCVFFLMSEKELIYDALVSTEIFIYVSFHEIIELLITMCLYGA